MPDPEKTRSPDGNAESGTMGRTAVQLGLALCLLVLLLPSPRTGFSIVDDSWVAVLHDSYANDRQFGRDIVFTYGPLGFMFAGTDPDTLAADIVLWVILSGLYYLFLSGITTPQRSLSRSLMVVSGALVVFVLASPDTRVFFGPAALAASLSIRNDDGDSFRARLAAGLAAAIVSLIKFSCFLASLPVVLLSIVDDLARRRRPVAAVSFAAGFVAFWLLSGQGLSNLPLWISTSIEMVSGYGSVMTTATAPSALALAGFLGTSLLVVVATYISATRGSGRFASLLPALALAWVIFAASKATFVRFDAEHLSTGPLSLVLIALVMLSISHGPGRRVESVLFAFALAASVAFSWVPVRTVLGESPPAAFVSRISERASLLAAAETADKPAARVSVPLSPGISTIDLYSVGHRALFEQGITYRPRPVFQSYGAYTKRLLQLNADHLRGEDAAETLLLWPVTIDGRYPAFDDSLSLPLFMSLYRVKDRHDEWIRLDRQPTRRVVTFIDRGIRSADMGEVVQLADSAAMLWAEIHVEPTLRYRLLTAAYRAPSLFLIVETVDGDTSVYRFHAQMASAGFLLSPVIDSSQALASIIQGEPPQEARLRSFMIRPEDPGDIGRFWARRYEVRLQALRVGPE